MSQILVVEDDAGMREWLTLVLEDAGHVVFAVENGNQAVSAARIQKFDLVITDISMPDAEGLGMIHTMRKSQPQLKILVISGLDAEVLLDAKILGARAALSKPVTAKAVLDCVGAMNDESH